MALQPQGVAQILEGGSLRVSGAQGSASAAFLPGFPALEGGDVLLRATFGAGEGNFEWSRREVLTAQGVVIDSEQQDLGRKTAGMVWTLDTRLIVGDQ
jgi:hypothetical protein